MEETGIKTDLKKKKKKVKVEMREVQVDLGEINLVWHSVT